MDRQRRTAVSWVLAAGFSASAAWAVNIDLVTVGNPGNAPDMRYNLDVRPEGFGRVDYVYQIGKFDVTAGQYTAFLNAVAATDTYGLYNTNMDYDGDPGSHGCNIKRSGAPGSYTYSVAPDWANRPVNWVSWGDAARFANWLSNGQPTGPQDATTTEDGSYALNGATTREELLAVVRKPTASWVIPTEDEWYKAAYYDPNKPGGAGYWKCATRSDITPINVLDPGGTNNANFNNIYPVSTYTVGAPYWRTQVGAFAGSPGPYGTFDQAGNVFQFTETVLRGSSFASSGGFNFFLYASYRPSSDRPSGGGSTGFRLALVPEPASILLLSVGGVALIFRPYRRPRKET